MRNFLEQVRLALEDSKLYYLTLFVCLTIPDICGAMSSDNGKATREKYKEWFDKYIAKKYSSFLTSDDCYRFRCSLLHQGSSQHLMSSYSRILFVEPSATTNVFHRNVLNDALNLDVHIFCADIIKGTEEWLKEYEGTEVYKKNCDKFMKRYPQGLPPYIVGVAVIS